ncbi:MAG: S-layer homology domain-containing protein [Firmicutes bacterium]|nr:S-layer homology domain-containing protein [Bacillota bacterium]
MKTKQLLMIALGITVILVGSALGAMAADLTDIAQSWAKPQIEDLVHDEIISGYPDKAFRPDNTVTRGEFAKLLTKAYDLEAKESRTFPDTKGHWAKYYVDAVTSNDLTAGYTDGTFRPDVAITRAEMVSMVTKTLEQEGKLEGLDLSETPEFSDVTPEFWAAEDILAAEKLGLLPEHFFPEFKPNAKATRAETAYVIAEGREVEAPATEQAQLDRGQVNLIDSVTDAAVELTQELFTPTQIQAVLSGDWGKVAQGLQYSAYDRLTAMQLAPWEAEAVLSRDWASLASSAKDRLASAVGEVADLSPELSTALVNMDWQAVQEYGQVEITQKLLAGILL